MKRITVYDRDTSAKTGTAAQRDIGRTSKDDDMESPKRQAATPLPARTLAATLCLIAASSVCAAFADEGPRSPPEPFGALESRDLAFCRSTGTQNEDHCVCSAASVEVPMTFNQFADYLRLGIRDPSTGRAIEVKLAKWAQYCGLDR